jgi:hypothetical protein
VLLELLTDPGSFFEGEHDPVVALAIVALTGVLWSSVPLITNTLGNPVFGGVGEAVTYKFWSIAGPAVLEAALALYILVGLYGLGRLLGGVGTLSATLWVLGWGYVPRLFAHLVSVVVTIAYLPGVDVGLTPLWTPLDLAVTLLPVAMMAVSAVLWYHGVVAVQDLDRWRAAAVVGATTAPLFVGGLLVNAGTLQVIADIVLVVPA